MRFLLQATNVWRNKGRYSFVLDHTFYNLENAGNHLDWKRIINEI